MNRQQKEMAFVAILTNVMGQVNQSAAGFPKPPQHPIAPPLNLGTPDPTVKPLETITKP